MTRTRRLSDDCRGASAVEFAILAPALVVILMGIVQVGLLVWAHIGLQHGASMAARCGAVDEVKCATNLQIATFGVQQSLGLPIPTSTYTVSTQTCGTQVEGAYLFTFGDGGYVMPSITLRSKACFGRGR